MQRTTLGLAVDPAAVLVVSLLLFVSAVAAATWVVLRIGPRVRVASAPRLLALWSWLSETTAFQALRRRYPDTWAFVAGRFSPRGYLGFHLTVGLTLSLGALVGFSKIAKDVIDTDQLVHFDVEFALWLGRLGSPLADRAFHAITLLGEPLTWAVVWSVVTVLLTMRRRWLLLTGWSLALAGGGALDVALKALIRRPRPVGAEGFLIGHTWSFPSGHAMGSLTGYGMLAYLLVLHVRAPATRGAAIAAAVVLVILIGLSRLYLGVHYFTDVIAGYAAGTVWLAACITGVELVRRRRSFKIIGADELGHA